MSFLFWSLRAKIQIKRITLCCWTGKVCRQRAITNNLPYRRAEPALPKVVPEAGYPVSNSRMPATALNLPAVRVLYRCGELLIDHIKAYRVAFDHLELVDDRAGIVLFLDLFGNEPVEHVRGGEIFFGHGYVAQFVDQ